MKSVILIPCRLRSTRFPNKPLANILGKPMIQWVYEAAEESDATDVFIITDSQEIINAVEAFDGPAILTSDEPQNGTERCEEAMEILTSDGTDYDIIINGIWKGNLYKAWFLDILSVSLAVSERYKYMFAGKTAINSNIIPNAANFLV